MKKILSAIMAVAMICTFAALFTSCGGSGEEFVIGITYFEPMNYFDENNKLTGFETEFAEAVCKKLGLTPKFQEIDWSAKETELNSGNIDCIWNGMTITPEREETMGISSPYMANKQVLVVKAENVEKYSDAANIAGANFCAEEGSAGAEVITTNETFAGANFVSVSTMATALMEVAAGTSDGCVIDYVTCIGMIGEGTDYAGLSVVEAYQFNEEFYGIAFRKDDNETREKFNQAIFDLMADGTVDAIAAKYKLGDLLVKG